MNAAKLHADWCPIEGCSDPNCAFQEAIALLIKAERERCAAICDEITDREAARMGLAHYEHLTGRQCAAAIRAMENNQ